MRDLDLALVARDKWLLWWSVPGGARGAGGLESVAYAHRREKIVIGVGGGSEITSGNRTSADG